MRTNKIYFVYLLPVMQKYYNSDRYSTDKMADIRNVYYLV